MRRIMDNIGARFERAREERKEKQEALRAEKVAGHSHTLECKRKGKIDEYRESFSFGFEPMMGGSHYILSASSTCTECGQQEVLHGSDRRHEFRNILDPGQLPPAVVTGIVECVRSAFGEAPGDTAEHIAGDRINVIPHDSYGEAFRSKMGPPYLGFSSLNFGSPAEIFQRPELTRERGVYLAATAVVKEMQGKGIGEQLNDVHLNTLIHNRLPVFFTRTQNPRLEGGIVRSLEKAKKKREIKSYTLERHLVPGHYGQLLTTQPQRTRVEQTQNQYDRIRSEQGDAFLLLFHVEYPERTR